MRYLDIFNVLTGSLALLIFISIVTFVLTRDRGWILNLMILTPVLSTNIYNITKHSIEITEKHKAGNITRHCADGDTEYVARSLNQYVYHEPRYVCKKWVFMEYKGDHLYEEAK